MKAKRRHELQENTLARVITQAPTFWQQSGGKMLLFAVALLAIVLLIRYRISSTRAANARAVDDLSVARSYINQLDSSASNPFAPAVEQSNRRKQFYAEALDRLEEVEKLTDDPNIRAEAALARGDVNWTVANLPELPGAATQPDLQVTRDPKELVKNAADAYRNVIEQYPNQQHAVIAARFGLAAVDENLGEWDNAKSQYEQIATIPNIPQAYLEQARLRLQKLPELREPVLLAAPATLPSLTSATTAPTRPAFGAVGPSFVPSTAPATQPHAPLNAVLPAPLSGASTRPTATTRPAR